MHLSFAYLGFVFAVSAAAGSHHLAGRETVARLTTRSEETKGGQISQKENLQMKCFNGCNGFPPPQPTSCWNAPAIFPGGHGVPPMNTFFSTVQSYTVITSNTVNIWSGGIDIQTILLQFQVMVVSISTLLAGFQGGCPYQAQPTTFISTFAPFMIQIQTMLTIITQQCGGNFGPFQQSFSVLTVLIQSIIGIGISMQVDIQQFFSACQFNSAIWQGCGFPAGSWIGGHPGGFAPNGFPAIGGHPGGFVPNPIDPDGLPSGSGRVGPNGIPGSPVNPGVGPQVFPGGPDGRVIGFFSGLSSLGQLLLALINVLEPIFHGIDRLLQGVGLLVGNLGDALGGLLEPDHGFLGIL